MARLSFGLNCSRFRGRLTMTLDLAVCKCPRSVGMCQIETPLELICRAQGLWGPGALSAMPEPRKYKYVSWQQPGKRYEGGWVGQVRDPQTGQQAYTCNRQATQLAAAKTVAKILGVSVTALQLRPAQGRPTTCKYMHVYPRGQQWRVQIGSTCDSYHSTQKEAAEAAAKILGCEARDLVADLVPASVVRQRMSVLEPLYKQLLPLDLEDAVGRATSSAKMYRAEPTLQLICLQGKYGPFRTALLEAWTTLQAKPGPQRSRRPTKESRSPGVKKDEEMLKNRAAHVFQVLVLAVRKCSGQPMAEWVRNCGNLSHVSGFIPVLTRLGMVTHGQGGRRNVHLGANGLPYSLPIGPRRTAAAHRLISKYVQAADAFAEVLRTPPRTCSEWLDKLQVLTARLEPIKAPGLASSCTYTLPWTFRAWAISSMRKEGIKSLGGAATCTLARFQDMFPDQKDVLGKLRRSWNVRRCQQGQAALQTAKDLMDELAYKGPPELLTCRLCLASAADLGAIPGSVFRAQAAVLKKCMQDYRALHQLWPCPAVLMRLVSSGNDQATESRSPGI